MKRYILLLILLVATPAAGRDIYTLDAGWRFFDGAATSSDGAQSVTLPHTCDGTGNYLKELDVPAEWADRRVFVHGYGGGPVLEMFVNGRLAGEHRGGYTAWQFEITGLLEPGGRNYIHIICSPAARFDLLPAAGDMEITGGLFRDVELVVTGKNALEDMVVVPRRVSRERVEGEVVVQGGGMARVEITDPDGNAVVSTSGSGTVPFSIDDPQLWHGRRAPNLYRVTAMTDSDTLSVTTGFRNFEVDPVRGFLLNGESYPLRGVVVHQDRPLVGAAITRTQVEEDVELILEMGANAVRVEGVVHHPAFYEMCDRAGVVVWSDFPLVGETFLTDKAYVPTETFRNTGRAQSMDVVGQQRNHPCVAMWGVFSNLSGRGDDPVQYISELNDLAKNEDPMRLTAASSQADGDINFVTDLICWAHHFGWTGGLPEEIVTWKEHFFREWSGLRSAVSYGAGASVMHQEPSPSRPDYLGPRHPERWQTRLHEVYYSALRDEPRFWGVWLCNMFDYPAPRRTEGERGMNDMGLVTCDRKVCKDAYYYYKAQWNTDDGFVYIAERRWNARPGREHNFRVFSNLPEVDLVVNGVSAGVLTATDGVFVWNNIALREGANNIEARSGDRRDGVRIEITSGRRQL